MFYRTFFSNRTFKLISILSVSLFASGNAVALGLGDLVVHSRLGQALRAEIRLVETPGTSHPGETCFRLGASEGSEALPVLMHARLRLEETGGQSRLLITSSQTINEPVLLVNVHVGCGAELVRSYTVLVDPGGPVGAADSKDSVLVSEAESLRAGSGKKAERPDTSGRAMSDEYPTTWETVEGESAKSITRALFPRQPKAQRRFLKALRAANPQVDFGESGDTPLETGVSLEIPDTRRVAIVKQAPEGATETSPPRALKTPSATQKSSSDGKMSDRLMISGDAAAATEAGDYGTTSDLGLRLSSDLSILRSDEVSENTRTMLRVEYKLLNALVFQAEKQLELAEQLRNLEARFDEMRAVNAGAMKTADEAQAASTSDQPPLAEAPKKTPVVDTDPPKAKVAPAKVPATGSIGWWQTVLLVLIMAGTLAWWLTRRHHAAKVAETSQDRLLEGADVSLSAASAIAPRGVPAQVDPWEAAEAEAAASATSSDSPLDVLPDVSRPMQFREESDARTVPPAAAIDVNHVEEADDSSTVLELAEIMVSFGRIKGAAQALAEYLENNPDTSLLPWLKLLDIFRTNDMPEDFAAWSGRLRSHFNVAPATWEEAGKCLGDRIEPLNENDLSIEDMLCKLPTVSLFPHVRAGILRTWDTNEGVAYLKHLLRDTRNGQRTGFPLSIARELLFLLDLQEARLRHAD